MSSFDVVSQVNLDEVRNGVNQATREINTRFDFKGKKASFELEESQITMRAPDAVPAQPNVRHPDEQAGEPKSERPVSPA